MGAYNEGRIDELRPLLCFRGFDSPNRYFIHVAPRRQPTIAQLVEYLTVVSARISWSLVRFRVVGHTSLHRPPIPRVSLPPRLWDAPVGSRLLEHAAAAHLQADTIPQRCSPEATSTRPNILCHCNPSVRQVGGRTRKREPRCNSQHPTRRILQSTRANRMFPVSAVRVKQIPFAQLRNDLAT